MMIFLSSRNCISKVVAVPVGFEPECHFQKILRNNINDVKLFRVIGAALYTVQIDDLVFCAAVAGC